MNKNNTQFFVKEEDLVYLVILLLAHHTIMVVMVETNQISYDLAKWFVYPVYILVPLIALINNIGIRKKWINRVPENTETKLGKILFASIIVSATIFFTAILIL